MVLNDQMMAALFVFVSIIELKKPQNTNKQNPTTKQKKPPKNKPSSRELDKREMFTGGLAWFSMQIWLTTAKLPGKD